ncbi:MAG: enoyl-CoA hydratase/isomerase family protein [Promethearchaeota archaeon]
MKIEDFQDIIYEKEDNGICTITINQPKRRNAMSFLTFLEIRTALEDMEKDKNAKVLIITGSEEGKAFSSGGYFNMNLLTRLPKDILDRIDLADIAQKKLCMAFWQFSKPVIAAINGLAVGAGITMPLAGSDLIYMADDAWLGFYFVKRAVIPEFSLSFILPFYVGFQKAKEIIYFGDKISAQEAERLGLVNKVVPHDELLPYVRKQALRLIPPKAPSLSIKLMKKTMHAYFLEIASKTLDLENFGLRETMKTHDFREALKSLTTKKEPVFKGK